MRSWSPEASIKLPMHPRKLISICKPPNCNTTYLSTCEGLLLTMSFAFHYNGWSKVITGITLYFAAWSHRMSRVENMQDMSVGSMLIICKNTTLDCPGWSPMCTACIIPDHTYHGGLSSMDIQLWVASMVPHDFILGAYQFSILCSELYIHFAYFCNITCWDTNLWYLFAPNNPQCDHGNHPPAWQVLCPSSVWIFWSTLSAANWMNCISVWNINPFIYWCTLFKLFDSFTI